MSCNAAALWLFAQSAKKRGDMKTYRRKMKTLREWTKEHANPPPGVGFIQTLVNWFAQAGSFATVGVIIASWGFAPGFYIAGTELGNQSMVNFAAWATTLWGTTVIGSAFFALFALIAIFGVRVALRYVLIGSFIVAYIGLFAMIFFLASTSHSTYVGEFNKFFTINSNVTNAYGSVITSFQKAGYPSAVYSYAPTVLLLGLGVTGWANLYGWSAFVSGEIKKGNSLRRQIVIMAGANAITGILWLIVALLMNSVIGYDLPRALTALSIDQPQLISGITFNWGAVSSFLIYLTAPNAAVVALYTVATIAMALAFGPVFYMILTRILFAMSFDRMLPSFLSDVNQRFHTPIKATVISFVVTEALFLAFTWSAQFYAYVIGISLLGVIAILITTTSAVLFPLRGKLRSLYNMSPLKGWSIGGVPIILIVGFVGMFYAADNVYQLLTLPLLGFGSNARYVTASVYIVVFFIYVAAWSVRKRQGIDLKAIFSEIPPEEKGPDWLQSLKSCNTTE
jgi:amino acid transporter